MFAPVAQGRENGQFAGIRQAASTQGLDEFLTGAAQKGVGRLLQSDGERDGRAVCRAQKASLGETALDIGIGRLASKREGQVVGGVFVRAIDKRIVGQGGQTLQRMLQLRERPLEIPAAACAEHDISAEHHSRSDEGDVIIEVSGYLDDVEYGIQHIQSKPITLT